MFAKRRALSEVISTTILVAAMLVIVTGVMGFALNLFNTQTQEAEFSQAQNGMVTLAQTVDSVIPTPGASAFASFNTRSGGPVLVMNYDRLSLNITGPNNVLMYSNFITINELRYRAGPLVSFQNYQWIRAGQFTGQPFATSFASTMIIQNNSAPLGFVFASHDSGSTWVTMDFRRVNVNNLGIFNVSLGAVPIGQDAGGNTIYKQIFQEINMVQINLVNLIPGNFSGSGNLNVVASNQGIKTTSVVIQDPQSPNTKGYYQVLIRVGLKNFLPGQSSPPVATLILNVPYGVQVPNGASCTSPNGPQNYCSVTTVINVVVSTVQLSFQGA